MAGSGSGGSFDAFNKYIIQSDKRIFLKLHIKPMLVVRNSRVLVSSLVQVSSQWADSELTKTKQMNAETLRSPLLKKMII